MPNTYMTNKLPLIHKPIDGCWDKTCFGRTGFMFIFFHFLNIGFWIIETPEELPKS